MTNSKTGAGTFAAVLALSRVFAEAAHLPGESTEYGMQRFTVIILSFLLTAAVFVPLFAAAKATGGQAPLSVISSRSKVLSGFFGLLLSAYLLASAADTGLRAHYYASGTFFDSAPSLYFYIFTGAALVFAVYKGLETVTRAGTVTVILLIMLTVLICAALFSCIHIERLYPSLIDDTSTLWEQVKHDFSRNTELLIFTALYGRINGKRHIAAPVYLGTACFAILLMTFLYNTVLGSLTSRLELPFYTLSSISDIVVLHRINGIDAAIWVMAGIIRLALFSLAFGETVRLCFTNEKAARVCSILFALAALALSALFTAYPALYTPIRRITDSGMPLALITLIPLTAAICTLGRKERKAV